MAKTKIKFTISKQKNRPLDFDNVPSFLEFDNQLPEDDYVVEIRRAYKSKTSSQLGAHFGLMIASAIAQANDSGMDTSSFLKEMVKSDLPSGIGLTTDFLKEIFYCLCPIYRAGKRITLSKASTLEASKHFEDCRTLLAAHGIYVPEPDKSWRTE
jgi:hypothetical protein